MQTSIGKRVFAGMVLVSFTIQALFGSMAEANIWEERRQQKQLAAVPASSHSLTTHLPQIHRSLRKPSPSKSIHLNQTNPFFTLLPSLTSNLGRIDSVTIPKGDIQGRVVLIQDIHLNAEAQTNIAGLLQNLINTKTINVVGVEGAFEALQFDRFRFFKDKDTTRAVMDAFLQAKLMAAPSYVGITSPIEPPLFMGVDDKPHYDANVGAYLDSKDEQAAQHRRLDATETHLRNEKNQAYTTELMEVDSAQSAFQQGTLNMSAYLNTLAAHHPVRNKALAQFLEATTLETQLDFHRVERERHRAVQSLARRMTEQEVQTLLEFSLLYRAGQMGFGDYHRHLRSLCDKNNVSLSDTPEFKKYIRYVILADGIQPKVLFKALREFEKTVFSSLAKTNRQKDLVERTNHLHLERKLVSFSLTPEAWEEYKDSSPRSGEGRRGKPRDLIYTPPTLPSQRGGTFSFEEFYRHADIRSEKIVENLIHAGSPASATQHTVLVVGGFHTPHIIQKLKEKGYATLVVSPTITKVESQSGASYLSVFSREKTPLDRLFEGKKLSINPAQANISHPVFNNRVLSTHVAHIYAKNPSADMPEGVHATSPRPGLYRVAIDKLAFFFTTIKGKVDGFLKRGASPTGLHQLEPAAQSLMSFLPFAKWYEKSTTWWGALLVVMSAGFFEEIVIRPLVQLFIQGALHLFLGDWSYLIWINHFIYALLFASVLHLRLYFGASKKSEKGFFFTPRLLLFVLSLSIGAVGWFLIPHIGIVRAFLLMGLVHAAYNALIFLGSAWTQRFPLMLMGTTGQPGQERSYENQVEHFQKALWKDLKDSGVTYPSESPTWTRQILDTIKLPKFNRPAGWPGPKRRARKYPPITGRSLASKSTLHSLTFYKRIGRTLILKDEYSTSYLHLKLMRTDENSGTRRADFDRQSNIMRFFRGNNLSRYILLPLPLGNFSIRESELRNIDDATSEALDRMIAEESLEKDGKRFKIFLYVSMGNDKLFEPISSDPSSPATDFKLDLLRKVHFLFQKAKMGILHTSPRDLSRPLDLSQFVPFADLVNPANRPPPPEVFMTSLSDYLFAALALVADRMRKENQDDVAFYAKLLRGVFAEAHTAFLGKFPPAAPRRVGKFADFELMARDLAAHPNQITSNLGATVQSFVSWMVLEFSRQKEIENKKAPGGKYVNSPYMIQRAIQKRFGEVPKWRKAATHLSELNSENNNPSESSAKKRRKLVKKSFDFIFDLLSSEKEWQQKKGLLILKDLSNDKLPFEFSPARSRTFQEVTTNFDRFKAHGLLLLNLSAITHFFSGQTGRAFLDVYLTTLEKKLRQDMEFFKRIFPALLFISYDRYTVSYFYSGSNPAEELIIRLIKKMGEENVPIIISVLQNELKKYSYGPMHESLAKYMGHLALCFPGLVPDIPFNQFRRAILNFNTGSPSSNTVLSFGAEWARTLLEDITWPRFRTPENWPELGSDRNKYEATSIKTLLDRVGATSLVFQKRLRRTFEFKTDNGRYLRIKIKLRGDKDFEDEFPILAFYNGQENGSLFPDPLGNFLIKRTDLINIDSDTYVAFLNLLHSLGSQKLAESGNRFKAFVYVSASQDYTTYLSDPSISIDDFRKSLLNGIRWLFKEARRGLLHTSIFDPAHSSNEDRNDVGIYYWAIAILKPELIPGVLINPKSSIRYSNQRRIVGVADLPHVQPIDRIMILHDHFKNIRLSGGVQTDHHISTRINPRKLAFLTLLGNYLFGAVVHVADRIQEQEKKAWQRKKSRRFLHDPYQMKRYARLLEDVYTEAYATFLQVSEKEARSQVRQLADFEKMARQLALFGTSAMVPYLRSRSRVAMPKNIYGPEVSLTVGKHEDQNWDPNVGHVFRPTGEIKWGKTIQMNPITEPFRSLQLMIPIMMLRFSREQGPLGTWSIWKKLNMSPALAPLLEPLTLVAIVSSTVVLFPVLLTSSAIGIIILRVLLGFAMVGLFVVLHYEGVYVVGPDGRNLVFKPFENWKERWDAWRPFARRGVEFHWVLIGTFILASFLSAPQLLLFLTLGIVQSVNSHWFHNDQVRAAADFQESGFASLSNFHQLPSSNSAEQSHGTHANADTYFSYASPQGRIRVWGILDGMGPSESAVIASRLAAMMIRRTIAHSLNQLKTEGRSEDQLTDDEIEALLSLAMSQADNFLKEKGHAITDQKLAVIKQDNALRNDPLFARGNAIGGTTATVSLARTKPDGRRDIFTAQAGDTRAHVRINDGPLLPLTLDPPGRRKNHMPDYYSGAIDLDNLPSGISAALDRQTKMAKAAQKHSFSTIDDHAWGDFENRNFSRNNLGERAKYRPVIFKKSIPADHRVRLLLTTDGSHEIITLGEMDQATRLDVPAQKANQRLQNKVRERRRHLVTAMIELTDLDHSLNEAMGLTSLRLLIANTKFLRNISQGELSQAAAWAVQEWIINLHIELERQLHELEDNATRYSSSQKNFMLTTIEKLEKFRTSLLSPQVTEEIRSLYGRSEELMRKVKIFLDLADLFIGKYGLSLHPIDLPLVQLLKNREFESLSLDELNEGIFRLADRIQNWTNSDPSRLDRFFPGRSEEINALVKRARTVAQVFNMRALSDELNGLLDTNETIRSIRRTLPQFVLAIQRHMSLDDVTGIEPDEYNLVVGRNFGRTGIMIVVGAIEFLIDRLKWEHGDDRLDVLHQHRDRVEALRDLAEKPGFFRSKIDDATSGVIDFPQVENNKPLATWGTLLRVIDSLPSDLEVRALGQPAERIMDPVPLKPKRKRIETLKKIRDRVLRQA